MATMSAHVSSATHWHVVLGSFFREQHDYRILPPFMQQILLLSVPEMQHTDKLQKGFGQ